MCRLDFVKYIQKQYLPPKIVALRRFGNKLLSNCQLNFNVELRHRLISLLNAAKSNVSARDRMFKWRNCACRNSRVVEKL